MPPIAKLRELQQRCFELFASPGSESAHPEFVDNMIPARIRVQVYQNNAAEIARGTLHNGYPVLERLVGDRCFRSLARLFAAQHPSRDGDLQAFSEPFPRFIHAQYAGSTFDYLPDIAALEHAVDTALLCAERTPLPISGLQAYADRELAGLRLDLPPSLMLVESRYPILSIWRANRNDSDEIVDLRSGEQRIAVMRAGDEVQMHVLDEETFRLAKALRSVGVLGAALDLAGIETSEQIQRSLHRVFEIGCVVAITSPDATAADARPR